MTPVERGAFGIKGTPGSLTLWMALLVIVHAVGIAGVTLFDAHFILDLTAINLLLTALVVLGFGHPDDAWRWALTAYITYAVEVIGVQTGFPFGAYQYGSRLGPTLYDTPPMIGVLWLLTLMGTLYWAEQWAPDREGRDRSLLRAGIAATLMVAFDIVLEPVAIRTEFWTWSGNTIPLRNYVSWWIIAFGLAWAWRKAHTFRTNRAAGLLLILQTAFFIGLSLLPWKF
ncbi:MAG TPA: carotenoid biosynthesis protein [Flavobacteriales bacterium]|jgi:putative membrane protein|nr:carotenoid biosynthesis protein [Flavobacteriales bacterium]